MKLYQSIFIGLCLTMLSCGTSEICDDDSQSYMKARFRTLVDGETRDTIIDSLVLYGIREGWPDSLIYTKETLGEIQVPLDPHHEESRFVFSSMNKSDTLVVYHNSEAYLISYDCGFAVRFTLKQFDRGGRMIRDVKLREPTVDAELLADDAHIWIYF